MSEKRTLPKDQFFELCTALDRLAISGDLFRELDPWNEPMSREQYVFIYRTMLSAAGSLVEIYRQHGGDARSIMEFNFQKRWEDPSGPFPKDTATARRREEEYAAYRERLARGPDMRLLDRDDEDERDAENDDQ